MAVCDKVSIVDMLHLSMMVRKLKPVVLRQSVLNTSNACLRISFREEDSFLVNPTKRCIRDILMSCMSLIGSMRYRCVLRSTRYIFCIDVLYVL